ncbi:hypothetical protein ACIBBG_34200 [Micromonospora chersina]|uniref:hypothetical protein n=1 Tax=Micromonospora chersina TaxID=47854 RepID=UPI0037BDC351
MALRLDTADPAHRHRDRFVERHKRPRSIRWSRCRVNGLIMVRSPVVPPPIRWHLMKHPDHAPEPRILPDDWWTTADVLDYLGSLGAGIACSTWSTYVARGQAPAAEGR